MQLLMERTERLVHTFQDDDDVDLVQATMQSELNEWRNKKRIS